MNKPLTLGSLFDGSGTFPMMGMLSGIVPKWSSEIEPFPIAVTTKRLPFVSISVTSIKSMVRKLNPWILLHSVHPALTSRLLANVKV